MPQSPAFYRPRSVAEAVSLLAELGDDAKVVAGGTALTIMLRERLIAPGSLVWIGGLPDLDGIEVRDGELRLGALVRHRDVERSPLVREHLPVLADAFGKVANVRVRNAATVGGVLAEADYASDPPAVFRALDAVVEVTGPDGTRDVAVEDFLVAFYQTALETAELVTAVRVPLLDAGTGAVYEKFVTRSSEDRPCVGVCAVVRLADDGTLADVRAAVGAAAEVPLRLRDAEAAALGAAPDAATFGRLADAYADAVDPLDDMRGSAWYRREMVRVWVRRALEHALEVAAR